MEDLSMLIGFDVDKKSVDELKNDMSGALGSVGKAVKTGLVGATATVSAVGAAASVASKQIYDMASACASAGDKIDEQSQILGMSTEAYQEWEYVLSLNGASIDSMGTALKKMNNTVQDALNGSAKATETFSALGLSMDELKGKSKEEMFEASVKALQGVEDASKRAALADDLFGRASVDMAALLNSSSDSVDALKQQAHDLGAVMSQDDAGACAAFADSMDNLNRSVSGVKNKITSQFLPGITSMSEGLTKLITGNYEEGVADIKNGIFSFVDNIGGLLEESSKVVSDLLPQLLPIVSEALLTLMNTAMQFLTDNMSVISDTVIQLITSFCGFILENLPMLIKAAVDIIMALATGLAASVDDLVPVVIDIIGTIFNVIVTNLPTIIQAALKIIQALAKGIIDYIPELIDALPNIINSIIDFITDNLPEIIKMGIDIVIALAGGLIQAIPQLVSKLPEIVISILTGIGEAAVSIVDVGVHIVEGLWEGILSMGSWIGKKVKGFFSGIVDDVKGILGIHSPSRVFASIGNYMGQGLGIGFEDAMKGVSKDIESAIPTNFSSTADISANVEKSVSVSGLDTCMNSMQAQSGSKNIEIHLHIQNAFGDEMSMRSLAEGIKSQFESMGMETGSSVVFA